MLVAQRTQLLNGLRGHLAEVGVIAAQGTGNMRALAALIHEGDASIPEAVRASLMPLVGQIAHLDAAIRAACRTPRTPSAASRQEGRTTGPCLQMQNAGQSKRTPLTRMRSGLVMPYAPKFPNDYSARLHHPRRTIFQ